jgi:UDP-GlcNAc:undecaprenyl-phosphate GlcNAc-1-phosphate transferase
MGIYGPIAIGSFLAALLMCLFLERIAVSLRLLDMPGHRKLQSAPVPRAGGLAILTAFILLMLITKQNLLNSGFAGAVIIFLGGFYDDRKPLNSVREKLFFQILGVLAAMIYFQVNGVPVIFNLLAAAFIFLMINSFNLMDNMNGVAAGLSIIILCAVAYTHFLDPISFVILSCALVAFLARNFPFGKIFLGDQGSQFLGYWLSFQACRGILVLSKTPDNTVLFKYSVSLVVLFAPFILDTLTVIFIRLRKGTPLTVGDQNHLSYQLLKLGFTTNTAPLFLISLQAVFAVGWLLIISAWQGSI